MPAKHVPDVLVTRARHRHRIGRQYGGEKLAKGTFPALRAMQAAGHPQRELLNAVVATAEGYAFPTNLDSDQPIGTLAPPSQVDTVLAALSDDMTAEQLDVALRDQNDRRKP